MGNLTGRWQGDRMRRRLALSAKRLIDIVGAGTGLALLSPVLAAVAVTVRLRLGKPVLFSQSRPGYHGQLFTIYKFRTMSHFYDESGQLLPDADRLTRLGRFLRETSLDELPELFNVLKGEMSLVGPRPLLPEYLDRYAEAQRRRHDMVPGVTGWSQVLGRNSLSWDEKLALDVWYVDHWSMALDFRILARTFAAVVRRQGISAEGHVTMPAFKGLSPRPPPDTEGSEP